MRKLHPQRRPHLPRHHLLIVNIPAILRIQPVRALLPPLLPADTDAYRRDCPKNPTTLNGKYNASAAARRSAIISLGRNTSCSSIFTRTDHIAPLPYPPQSALADEIMLNKIPIDWCAVLSVAIPRSRNVALHTSRFALPILACLVAFLQGIPVPPFLHPPGRLGK